MSEQLKKMGIDYAYLIDKGMVLIVLYAVYTLAMDFGAKWIAVQAEMVAEMVEESKDTDARWKVMVEMAKQDDISDATIMREFTAAVEKVGRNQE